MGVCHVFQIVQVVPNRAKHPKWSLHWTQFAKIILLIFTMAISRIINACTQIDSEMEIFFEFGRCKPANSINFCLEHYLQDILPKNILRSLYLPIFFDKTFHEIFRPGLLIYVSNFAILGEIRDSQFCGYPNAKNLWLQNRSKSITQLNTINLTEELLVGGPITNPCLLDLFWKQWQEIEKHKCMDIGILIHLFPIHPFSTTWK